MKNGISPKTLGGDFIQEGADNIDLNTETIDGKNTMHSMARAVFPFLNKVTVERFMTYHVRNARHFSVCYLIDLSHHRSLQFILMTFLSWLVDDNCFHIESDYIALSHDKARKFIAVAEMIISLHKNNFTPFNLARHFSVCYLMVCDTGQNMSHFSVRSTNTKCMKGFK
jgi:hypothetical protein